MDPKLDPQSQVTYNIMLGVSAPTTALFAPIREGRLAGGFGSADRANSPVGYTRVCPYSLVPKTCFTA